MLTEIPVRQLGLAVQLCHLQSVFPNSFSRIKDHCELEWRGQLQPTPISTNYVVGLSYRIGKRPRVEILEPDLTLPELRSEIHMFRDESLCLYFMDEWTEDMVIAKTIIPWACEWLLHYELWVVTGQWLGGGIHLSEDYAEKMSR